MAGKYTAMGFHELASALPQGGLEERLVEVNGSPKSVVPHITSELQDPNLTFGRGFGMEYFGMLGSADSNLLLPFALDAYCSGGFQAAFLVALHGKDNVTLRGEIIGRPGAGGTKTIYYLRVHYVGDGKQEFP